MAVPDTFPPGRIERRRVPRTEPRPVRLRLLRFLPPLIILGLLVHLVLPRIGSVEESLKMIRSLLPWAIAWAFLYEGLSYLANGALLQSVVYIGGGRMKLGRAVAIEMGAATVALVAAGALGFGASIYRWTRDSGVSRDKALLTTWMPSLFDSIALITFALIGALQLLIHHRLGRATEAALGIVLAALGAGVSLIILLLIREDWLNAIVRRATRWIRRIRPATDEFLLQNIADHAAEAWSRLRKGAWIRPAACSIMFLTFDVLCLRYAFLAVRQQLFISTILAGYGVPMLLGRSSFLPGGIAVVEVAMAAIYGGLGVPAAAAVVGVLTYRLISFWLPSLVGIPIAVALESRHRRSRRARPN